MQNLRDNMCTTFLILTLLLSCVNEGKDLIATDLCKPEFTANISMEEISGLFAEKTRQITEDLIMEGYVISTDQYGNIFGSLYIQDHPSRPNLGIKIEIDLQDSYLFFPLGQKILIRLQGLYIGKQNDLYKLGGALNSFGNISVGRLPSSVIFQHLYFDCRESISLIPSETAIVDLQEDMVGTLINIRDVEVVEDEKGLPYASYQEETKRLLTDCDGNTLVLLNSGYSTFYDSFLSEQKGRVTGVLTKKGKEYRLILRDTNDLELREESCLKGTEYQTSNNVLISEIADPYNNTSARFIELYNHDSLAVNMNGWVLKRYTNSNLTESATVALDEFVILPNASLVITSNKEVFNMEYGLEADLEVKSNSVADSNGDDNFELVDPFGVVKDAFGIIGEDGTDTNHDFENGKAVRKQEITNSNPTYFFDEWEIYNSNNVPGTIDGRLYSPMDYNPGNRL